MGQSLTIMLAEVALVAVIGLAVVVFRQSRQKTTGHRELEYLLEDFQSYQSLRAKKISHWLINHHEMEPAVAQALTLQLQAAEKQFMAAYVKQQLDGSVAEFYDKLCQLLDVYLKAEVSTLPSPAPQPPEDDASLSIPNTVAAPHTEKASWLQRLKSCFSRKQALDTAAVAVPAAVESAVEASAVAAETVNQADAAETAANNEQAPKMLDGSGEEPNKWGDVFD